MATLRVGRACLYGLFETFGVGDVVIGGEKKQDAVRVEVADDLGGDGRRRRGIAAHRLQHEGRGGDAELLKLGGDHEAVVGIGNHERGCDPVHAREP